jgi:hypothetical protein
MSRHGIKFVGLVSTLVLSALSLANEFDKETLEERRERLRISVQAICPVSGKPLGEQGKPIKLTNPESKEVLYVCCKECLKQSPDTKYLDQIRNNFAKAQGHCLVMADNEVSAKSKHGIIEGQFIYVCCPPCIKKMAAAPKKYLAALDDLYESSLKK